MKLPRTIPWPWIVLLTGLFGVALIVLIGLVGCSSSYWVKTRDPVLVLAIHEVSNPCGRTDLDGCFMPSFGTIEIKRGLPALLRECVFLHEMHHAAGFTHEEHAIQFATDCGDGRIVN